MNSHKNARTTFEGRKLLIERIATMGLKPAAQAAGISERTARKWLKRFEGHGVQGLLDRSSRPMNTRSSINEHLAERIERLRRKRMPMRRIAVMVGRSVATAPMSNPPALPPMAYRCLAEVNFSRIRNSAQSMKSWKVFTFFINLPSSYHKRPISCPPRI